MTEKKPSQQDSSLTTSKVLSRIRSARTPDDAVTWHAAADEPAFHEVLYALLKKRGLTPKEMIRSTHMERSYFYHLLSGEKKHPSRNMVLRIGLCAGADLEEMNRLLRLAGVPGLYPKIRRDAILIYAIQHKQSMEQTNRLLREKEETPLYREE